MSDNRNAFGSFVAFLAGTVVGAGLALLYAPQSGKETRQKLRDAGERVGEDLKRGYERLSTETQKAVDAVKTTSEKAVGQIREIVDSAKNRSRQEDAEE